MHLPSEIVDVFLTALPAEAEPAVESKKHAAGTIKKLLEEIRTKMLPTEGRELSDIHDILHGKIPMKNVRYRSAMDVLKPANLMEGDVGVAGFGTFDPLTDFKNMGQEKTVTQKFTEGYRSAMDAHLRI
jgi:hypothetical protein